MSEGVFTLDASTMKFPLGAVLATPGVLGLVTPADMQAAIARHIVGDWGDVTPEDAESNEDALRLGNRILSVYKNSAETVLWIITEADRSATTLLLPDEY